MQKECERPCRRYLCPLAHLQESTDRVEGSCATDVQVGLVVRLQHADEVIALFLERREESHSLHIQSGEKHQQMKPEAGYGFHILKLK